MARNPLYTTKAELERSGMGLFLIFRSFQKFFLYTMVYYNNFMNFVKLKGDVSITLLV